MKADFSAAERVLKNGLAEKHFSCACAAAGVGQEMLWQFSLGRLSCEASSPECTPETRFDLASLTKPLVTAMLTLLAVEEGRLCLWDTLGEFFPAPEDKKDISVKQLLTHTSGFPGAVHLWKELDRPEDSLGFLLNTPLAAQPGTRVEYCSGGYLLLGKLLEQVWGMPLQDAAREKVFQPLGMEHTGFLPRGGNIAATERQADGSLLQGAVHDENVRFLGGVAGSAGVFSTAEDLSWFVRMLAAEGKLPDGRPFLSSAAVKTAFSNHTPGMLPARGLGFHLPWMENGYTGDLFPPETVGHTGFTGTSFALDPVSGIWLVLLTNRVCPSREDLAIYRIRRLTHNAVYAALCQWREAP